MFPVTSTNQLHAMLNKEEFINFILADPKGRTSPSPTAVGTKQNLDADALGGHGFVTNAESTTVTFARQLLEASGFGPAQYLATGEVILGEDPAANHLPERVFYWPKTTGRPYQTILFELTQASGDLLTAKLFRPLKGVLEDALTALVQRTLIGFETGGERRRADVKQGKQDETLCVVSIRDERNKESRASHLICFGTVARGEGSLETFHIREEARFWEPQLTLDHLERLYDRHFMKLATEKWQDAFISGEERKLARKLLDVSHGKKADESKIQEAVVDLLEQIALSYGLKKKPGAERRLEATDLPQDHDIGIKDGELGGGRKNPFRGMTLRDAKNRLLGYIIYCLDQKEDADVLRAHLEKNNRFHNVLVVYPNGDSTGLELWQGNKPLQGNLTKRGAKFEGEGQVVNLLSRFFVVSKALVSKPKELAEELAYRARYLRGFALRELEKPEKDRDKDFSKLYISFHDIFLKGEEKGKDKKSVEAKKHDEFADSYAQTLTYGLLSARWISKDDLAAEGERFTLNNATGHLERTSPFFKDLFTQVITESHDASRDWLLQDITDLLDRIDIDAVFSGLPDDGALGHDPVMHFYEPFLAAYDPGEKKKRGVFYTPYPVVSYIVRSVHELLQTEFGLKDGLADTSTWSELIKKHPDLKLPIIADEQGNENPISGDEPFVLILDPATGTATFLVEVIDVIYRTLVAKWKKQSFTEAEIDTAWNEYVSNHLLPRLYGYELMMAPYAIAHLKIGLKLAETGYKFTSKERARVYLTNALEPAQDLSGQLKFDAPALAHEAASVNEIKRHKRFTVVIGNPPYAGISANLNEKARELVGRFKFIDGVKVNERGALQLEKNLQDDYIKFLAFAEDRLSDSAIGVCGMICNHGFIDNPTLRGVRWSLLSNFHRLWVLDLHGNVNRGEKAPDGRDDQNVFDIKDAGVAIYLGSKGRRQIATNNRISKSDVWGDREAHKYPFLGTNTYGTHSWETVTSEPEFFLFRTLSQHGSGEFNAWPKVTEVFPLHSIGMITARDGYVIDFTTDPILERAKAFRDSKLDDVATCKALGIPIKKGWNISRARERIRQIKDLSLHVRSVLYRPFDVRPVFYHESLIWGMAWPVMQHMVGGKNLALITSRMTKGETFEHVLVSNTLSEVILLSSKTSNNAFAFPLYLKSGNSDLHFDEHTNLAPQFLTILANKLRLSKDKSTGLPVSLTAENIFHYAYAVFHSPGYRNRYAEFLKIDFPRLPLTENLPLFRELSRLGGELTALHLFESPMLTKPITRFIGKSKEVAKIGWIDDTIWLDAGGKKTATTPGSSGFKGVPKAVWTFYIGGYQVCEKWLKDRKGRTLTDEDISHYQKIVVALSETIRLMAEIDKVINNHGGWPGAFQSGAITTDQ